MTGAFDNIHPGLSQQEAIRLLQVPVAELESQSDPYMAAAHLINFPGPETESALLSLVRDPDESQPKRLARRKAVEVLGRLGCTAAIQAIGACLGRDDPYLVENAAFALQQLGCSDSSILRKLQDLLVDDTQNQRVLVQSLSALNVLDALPVIQTLQASEKPGVRGAAISAEAQMGGSRERLPELASQMLLPNQMDRQSAIQDAIHASANELLPDILRAPVSPVFRMRALRALCPNPSTLTSKEQSLLLASLDALIQDRPESLELVHAYDQEPTNEFLIQEFFGTDFSRSYLSLQTLQSRAAEHLWPLLEQRWHDDAHNDYGAHYFFIRLIGLLPAWPDAALALIEKILIDAIKTRRPQFMKSKPAAVLAMASLGWADQGDRIDHWLNPEQTPFWEVRYAAVMSASPSRLAQAVVDPEPLVALRAQSAVAASSNH
ncbi:HEAT repeat domain-containing protein [Parasynechococcus sp.]|uniref:HEAT repeat domain-containing protein n=1 Tax=Parasynechococcus sp. TaxID=3101203 RepID=UPI0037047A45